MNEWFARRPNVAMVFAYLVGLWLFVASMWIFESVIYAFVIFNLFCVGAASWVLAQKGWSRWWALLQLIPLVQLSIFWFPNRRSVNEYRDRNRECTPVNGAVDGAVRYGVGNVFKIALAVCIVGIIAVVAILIFTDPIPRGRPESTFAPITFTGVDSRTTAPFYIPTREWSVDWSFDARDFSPGHYVFIFVIGERGKDGFAVWQLPESPSGSTYSYAGPGEYYLDVNAAGLNEWTITIRPP